MDIEQLRKLYSEAAKDLRKAEMLDAYFSTKQPTEPLLIAYKAAAEALKAKNAWDVFSKLAYITQSQNTFNEALKLEPENIEIRFLRFSIQLNIPFLLGFSKDLTADKNKILQNLAKAEISIEIKKAISSFLIESGRCSEAEIKQLAPFIDY